MNVFEKTVFDNSSPGLAQIINATNAGIWAYNVVTQTVTWSLGFYQCLGYQPGEIECSHTNFVQNLLYHEDKKAFLDAVRNSNAAPVQAIYIRLLTKTGYEWFQSTARKHPGPVVSGTLINVHSYRSALAQAATVNHSMIATSRLAGLAGWQMNVSARNLSLSNEALEKLGAEHPEIAAVQFLDLIEPAYRQMLHAALDACAQTGRPFELDVQLRTVGNGVIWVKIKAVALIDELGNCQTVIGAIQDIHLAKQREEELHTALKAVSHQNSRLQNFTHIAAHNLRSYVGNLQAMIHLYEEARNTAEHTEVFDHIKTIGQSLSATIEHLNEIAKIDFEASKEKPVISLDAMFTNAVNALQGTVQATQAVITSDFTLCPAVSYLPAYLESIFHNLLSNALKYRHPGRVPEIHCESKVEDGHIYLTFEDNGLGIDLKKYGHKVFGIYQTFHAHDGAQGIGLFITRNQVEAMGGHIRVESIVNRGTKFTILLG